MKNLLSIFSGGLWVLPLIAAGAAIYFLSNYKKDKSNLIYGVILAVVTICISLMIYSDK